MKITASVILYILLLNPVVAVTPGVEQVHDKIVVTWDETMRLHFLRDSTLFSEGWDTLSHTRFWSDIIRMNSDSCIVNIASCRRPVDKISRSLWMNQTEPEKICFKDSVCNVHCLGPETMLYITAGKGEFYDVKRILPEISKAITVFKENGCDPWYAQTILLIESPGRNKAKSSVGANGPFQLMRSVARHYGLRVNQYHDDRTDLVKAAKAASKLLKAACIPYIKEYVEARGIPYHESDLWFRLLVLHAYHAGAGNVRCVINSLNPDKGGIDLFLQIWQTTCGTFKNESQNYSQIAIASLLNFENLLQQDGDTVFLVRGDRFMKQYNRRSMKTSEAYDFLTTALATYEKDLVDGIIPFDYFMSKVNVIRKELSYIAGVVTKSNGEVTLRKYPASEEHVTALACDLTRRQRYDEAIKLLKINLDMHPESSAVLDSLAHTYLLSGDKKSAGTYSSKSEAMNKSSLSKGSE